MIQPIFSRFFVVFGVSLWVVACGPTSSPRPRPSSTQEGQPQPVRERVPTPSPFLSNFGLELVKGDLEGDTPEIPKFHLFGNENVVPVDANDRVRDQNQIVFLPKLFLRDPNSQEPDRRKPLFFAWPDQVGEKTIHSASYTHRMWDTAKNQLGSDQKWEVSHDNKGQFWYIPFSQMFGTSHGQKNPEDVNPDDLQELIIELLLSDGSKEVVTLHFQAAGPLPEVETTWHPRYPELLEFASGWGALKWPLYGIYVENKTARPLTIWIESDGSQKDPNNPFMEFRTIIGKLNPGGAVYEHGALVSTASVQLTSVEVYHENKDLDVKPLKNQQGRVSVTLRPKERIEIEWIGEPAQAMLCPLPEVGWGIGGGLLRGDLKYKLWVDHPTISLEQGAIQPSGHARLMRELKKKDSVYMFSGKPKINASPYSCSGWFNPHDALRYKSKGWR